MAAVLAVAVLVWSVVRLADTGTTKITAAGGPVSVSSADLVTLSEELDQPVYWAGPARGKHLEATRASDDSVFVRYLREGVPAGDPSVRFLTVATYPDANALRDLRAFARDTHAGTRQLTGGGLAVVVRHSTRSVYLAYPHKAVQVEVYDPHREHALALIKAGMIAPAR